MGIEPTSTGCRPVILPLNDFPMVAGIGVEPIYGAYETPDWAASLARNKTWCVLTDSNGGSSLIGRVYWPLYEGRMEPKLGIEPRPVAYQATALPLSYNDWSRISDSNRFLDFTRVPFFLLNQFDWSRVSESNGLHRFTGPAHRHQCLLDLNLWCGVRDSNPCRCHGKATSWPLDEPSIGARYGSPTRLFCLEDRCLMALGQSRLS